MRQVRIFSAGTTGRTRVLIDEADISDVVQKVRWEVEVGGHGVATAVLELVPGTAVEVLGELDGVTVITGTPDS